MGRIIFDHIRSILDDILASPGFGSLITKLCMVHRVRRLVGDVVEAKRNSLGEVELNKFTDTLPPPPQAAINLPPPLFALPGLDIDDIPQPQEHKDQRVGYFPIHMGGEEEPGFHFDDLELSTYELPTHQGMTSTSTRAQISQDV